MKVKKTRQSILDSKILSGREQSKLDKEKIKNSNSKLSEILKNLECPKIKTKGLCEFGEHNVNFNKNAIS